MGSSPAAWAAPTTQPSTQPVSIPFQLTETNHILVRLKINGQGPFNFIMDTGAPTMYVRIPVGKKLGLKPTTRGFATLDQLEIEGGAKLSQVKCVVQTPFQIEGMNAIGASGVELDGMLGYSVLAKFRLQIDLSKDRMIWTPLNFDPPPLVSGRRPAGTAPDQVDQDEEKLEATGGLLKLLGPLVKPADVPPQYRGLLGIELAETGNAVTVLRVMGNSPADKAGIDSGDRLISVNGQSVKSIADAQAAMQATHSGQAVTVVVQRNSAQLKLKISCGEGL
jgi:predicted aspartyl protease